MIKSNLNTCHVRRFTEQFLCLDQAGLARGITFSTSLFNRFVCLLQKLGQGHETYSLGGHEVKVYDHTMPKLELDMWHHSRPPQSSGSSSLVHYFG